MPQYTRGLLDQHARSAHKQAGVSCSTDSPPNKLECSLGKVSQLLIIDYLCLPCRICIVMEEICVVQDSAKLLCVRSVEQLLRRVKPLPASIYECSKHLAWRKLLRVGNPHERLQHGTKILRHLSFGGRIA